MDGRTLEAPIPLKYAFNAKTYRETWYWHLPNEGVIEATAQGARVEEVDKTTWWSRSRQFSCKEKRRSAKQETEPWRRIVRRGTSSEVRRCIDEEWAEVITYLTLITNTTFQSTLMRISHILMRSHHSHFIETS